MTVIAFKAGVMASDSRQSDEFGMHLSVCKKLFRLPTGAIYGGAGDSDQRLVIDMLCKAKTPKQLPSREALREARTNCYGLLVFPKGQIYIVGAGYTSYTDSDGEWAGWVDEVQDHFAAVGSGQQYAYGAMEFGATSQQAVRAACKRDLMCALPLQTMQLKTAA